MKKLLVIAIAAFAFTACNNSAAPAEETPIDSTAQTQVIEETTAVDTSANQVDTSSAQ
jgi:PBP1b-binding outer membrane lipoprotein LpoB